MIWYVFDISAIINLIRESVIEIFTEGRSAGLLKTNILRQYKIT